MNHRDGLDRSTGGKRVQSRPPTFQLSWLLPSQLKLLPFSLVHFITISRSRSKLFRKPERYSPGRRPALLTVRNFCPPLFHCGSDFNRWISTHADIYWTDDQPQTFGRIFSWSFSATNFDNIPLFFMSIRNISLFYRSYVLSWWDKKMKFLLTQEYVYSLKLSIFVSQLSAARKVNYKKYFVWILLFIFFK